MEQLYAKNDKGEFVKVKKTGQKVDVTAAIIRGGDGWLDSEMGEGHFIFSCLIQTLARLGLTNKDLKEQLVETKEEIEQRRKYDKAMFLYMLIDKILEAPELLTDAEYTLQIFIAKDLHEIRKHKRAAIQYYAISKINH